MSEISAVNGQVKADELKKIIEDILKDIELTAEKPYYP